MATTEDGLENEPETHDEPQATVARVFREEGYGFLKTPAGRDVFFHKNAVRDDGFERLAEGTPVRFGESEGQLGPKAAFVRIVDAPEDDVGEI